jgi:hypothetical protein
VVVGLWWGKRVSLKLAKFKKSVLNSLIRALDLKPEIGQAQLEVPLSG